MQFKENADVLTADGRTVGSVDRVVIDPKTREVTHLVVRKGFIFSTDKVISLDDVDSAGEDQVVLKEGLESEQFPDFEEKRHIPLDDVEPFRREQREGYARSIFWHHPYPGVGWWGTYPGYPPPRYIFKKERNVPPETMVLEEGVKVISADGSHVGDVERVFTDPDEHRATQILISGDLPMRPKKLIPTHWLDSVIETEIRLSVHSDLIDRLPAYDIDPVMK